MDSMWNRYNTPEEIIEDFIPVRQHYYEKRKEYELNQLHQQVELLANKEQFITLVMKKKLPLFDRSRDQLIADMMASKLKPLGKSNDPTPSFDYLTKMPLDTFSSEKLKVLKSDLASKQKQRKSLQETTPQSIWEEELMALRSTISAKE